LHSFVIYLNI